MPHIAAMRRTTIQTRSTIHGGMWSRFPRSMTGPIGKR